jgi:3-hydroxy-9,10-secoandrosta-1,3,5(10)-triene-9,17-dione monooxygenase reductase component
VKVMIDPANLRKVLSAYPTGVCVVSAQEPNGRRHAMVVGSFTSISLDPPLVGFFPAKTSTTWAAIGKIGQFSVNVLGAHQLGLCQKFAVRGHNKFGSMQPRATPGGQPLIDNVLAWLECTLEAIHEVGDHYLVGGRVVALEGDPSGSPLLFFGGKYHRIGEHVEAAPDIGHSR